MKKYVIMRDMATGNESVGEMWQETKIFDGTATLNEVMNWANFSHKNSDGTIEQHPYSIKRIIITKPHEEGK